MTDMKRYKKKRVLSKVAGTMRDGHIKGKEGKKERKRKRKR